jgi:hypothetical protein
VVDYGTVVLQICTDFLKIEPGSSSETCPASRDENHMTYIKVEEDPVPITFPGIKAEHEVSCISMCPLLGSFHKYPELCTVFLISICLSVNMKHLQCTEW